MDNGDVVEVVIKSWEEIKKTIDNSNCCNTSGIYFNTEYMLKYCNRKLKAIYNGNWYDAETWAFSPRWLEVIYKKPLIGGELL